MHIKNETAFCDKEIRKYIKLMNGKDEMLEKQPKKQSLRESSKIAGRGLRDRCKSLYGKISYAIPPFILFVAVLVLTYYGNQLIYSLKGGVGGSDFPKIPLDDKIPLVPWFVYPYFLTFPLGIIAFFYLAYSNKKAFFVMYRTLLISFAISGVIYLFWQTYFTKPDFVPTNFTERFVVRTWGSTYPINCFPSQHCFMAFGIIIGCLTGGKKMKWWFKAISIIISVMIVLATFFIKQHFFVDWIASLGIMLLAYAGVWLYYHLKEKNRKKKQ